MSDVVQTIKERNRASVTFTMQMQIEEMNLMYVSRLKRMKGYILSGIALAAYSHVPSWADVYSGVHV